MPEPLVDAICIILLYITFWFVVAQLLKDNGIMDVAWGIGFIIIAWWMHYFYPNSQRLGIALLVTIWGLRLSLYIFIRNLKKGKEDFRYANWRKQWGKKAMLYAFFKVFLLQGFVMWIVAWPILGNEPLGDYSILQTLGFFIALIGFTWEAIADTQLYFFKNKTSNKNKIMRQGLWAFSRHPNYFGEMVFWWGLYLFSLPLNLPYLSIVSPILLTFLLLKVSGVPMLEEKYTSNPEYQDYIRETNVFFPSLSSIFASLKKIF